MEKNPAPPPPPPAAAGGEGRGLAGEPEAATAAGMDDGDHDSGVGSSGARGSGEATVAAVVAETTGTPRSELGSETAPAGAAESPSRESKGASEEFVLSADGSDDPDDVDMDEMVDELGVETFTSTYHIHTLQSTRGERYSNHYCDVCFNRVSAADGPEYYCKRCEFDYCYDCAQRERADPEQAAMRKREIEIMRTSARHIHPLQGESGRRLAEAACSVCKGLCRDKGTIAYVCTLCEPEFIMCVFCLEQEGKRPALARAASRELMKTAGRTGAIGRMGNEVVRDAAGSTSTHEKQAHPPSRLPSILSARNLHEKHEQQIVEMHLDPVHAEALRTLYYSLMHAGCAATCMTIFFITWMVGAAVSAGRFESELAFPLVLCIVFAELSVLSWAPSVGLRVRAVLLHWNVLAMVLLQLVGVPMSIANATAVPGAVHAYCFESAASPPGALRCSNPGFAKNAAIVVTALAITAYAAILAYVMRLCALAMSASYSLIIDSYDVYTRPQLPWQQPKGYDAVLTIARLSSRSDSCMRNVCCSCACWKKWSWEAVYALGVFAFLIVFVCFIVLPLVGCDTDNISEDDNLCFILDLAHTISTGQRALRVASEPVA